MHELIIIIAGLTAKESRASIKAKDVIIASGKCKSTACSIPHSAKAHVIKKTVLEMSGGHKTTVARRTKKVKHIVNTTT